VALRSLTSSAPPSYTRFPEYWADPAARKWNLWGYIDERDADGLPPGLEADLTGSSSYVIAAADTVMNRPSATCCARSIPARH